jgi:hypothetical protein
MLVAYHGRPISYAVNARFLRTAEHVGADSSPRDLRRIATLHVAEAVARR